MAPSALTLLGPSEVLLEFGKETSVVEVGMVLHAMSDWDDIKVRTHCLMARCDSLINMFHEREMAEREKAIVERGKTSMPESIGASG